MSGEDVEGAVRALNPAWRGPGGRATESGGAPAAGWRRRQDGSAPVAGWRLRLRLRRKADLRSPVGVGGRLARQLAAAAVGWRG
ncbi:MAG: hypothetical protein LBT40_17375 [Deltaproteobacteria bacterium]|nr:hypothetical protein [Deltaproteobacteria bacterium]